MHATLPWILLVLAAGFLLGAIFAVFRSLRAAFGAGAGEAAAADVSTTERRRALLLEKESLVRSLADLAFERDAGKIAPDDFARIERKLRARAKQVLALLDEDAAPYRAEAEALLANAGAAPVAPEKTAAPAEAIATTPDAAPAPAPAPEPEPAVVAPSPALAASTTPTCAGCGATNDADAAFCKKCGAKLAAGDDGAKEAIS